MSAFFYLFEGDTEENETLARDACSSRFLAVDSLSTFKEDFRDYESLEVHHIPGVFDVAIKSVHNFILPIKLYFIQF